MRGVGGVFYDPAGLVCAAFCDNVMDEERFQ